VGIRFQPWQFALVVMVFCAGIVAAVRWRSNRPLDPGEMLAMLPADGSTMLYMDTAALRASGVLELLAGTRSAEEADYRRFVEESGFDYRTDLDAVAGAFGTAQGKDATYLVLRGRFQWKQLAAYAASQGGSCQYTTCTMPGSSEARNISFYPLRPNVLALAVGQELKGVDNIGNGGRKKPDARGAIVWLRLPAATLGRLGASLTWMAPLARAQGATLRVRPRDGSASQVNLELEVACTSAEQAKQVARQMSEMAATLRAAGLPSITGGQFASNGAEVAGAWTLDRAFLEKLVGGTGLSQPAL
jgi:hypothetical protein